MTIDPWFPGIGERSELTLDHSLKPEAPIRFLDLYATRLEFHSICHLRFTESAIVYDYCIEVRERNP